MQGHTEEQLHNHIADTGTRLTTVDTCRHMDNTLIRRTAKTIRLDIRFRATTEECLG